MTATQWMLVTLLPCGMPTSQGDRLLSTVMDEIDGLTAPAPTLTPEEVERIGRLNEARWPQDPADPRPNPGGQNKKTLPPHNRRETGREVTPR